MIFRMELTYHEVANVLDRQYSDASSTGYTLKPAIYEISDNNLMFKSFYPEEVKITKTINEFRLRSKFTTKKAIRLTGKMLFHTILGFTQSHSGVLSDFQGYIHLKPGT